MSKNQNHGKMKEWRKPEFAEGKLIHQERHKRRKTKGASIAMKAWMSPLMQAMFARVGLINKALPQV
jgi:hypothetical protein